MSELLAIDPGHTESAYILINPSDCRPIHFAKVPNHDLLDMLAESTAVTYIEMIASYGMAVGEEVFETCVWIGRFAQMHLVTAGHSAQRVKRLPIKLHHCHDSKAKDSNIIQALVDRFAMGQPNHGKGTKATPGWFYGFAKDVWQAYALAVYAADELEFFVPTIAIETVRTQGALL